MRRSLVFALSAVAVASAVGFQRQLSPQLQVKQIGAVVNTKALAIALNMYAEDADGIYPNVRNLKSLKVVTWPYVKDKSTWKTENPKSEIRFNSSVGGVAKASIKNPAEIVMFYESKPWPDGLRAVSFVDGHARLVHTFDWGKIAGTLVNRDLAKVALPLPEDLGKAWKD
ncbi:hypothetical protein [Fimbriimonas ginsengisoli]|uniref:Uncharacterized protein n=1 Tax=Fimbriimonas ginsengisoli Gsoil 348 TaxID=661478 RepID=A0A068NVG1_FIMGI|nr:hypothetical protein [Fimbriimonas ginsengisoli]AIE87367.1 hypothetical protein OP10G_3999 [Fimbriimonas ginsengisoli Gsoil 348]